METNMSNFAQGRYLVIKPKKFMSEAEIASSLNLDESRVEYIDPNINQECSDFYDDLGAAFSAKLDDFIQWDNLQVFLIYEDIKSTFFIIKESEIFLGAIDLKFKTSKRMRKLRLVIDKFEYYSSPKNKSDENKLIKSKLEIGTLINNAW